MADQESPSDRDTLTPAQMHGWLKEEIRDAAKAFELRVKEATAFVTAYALGELSPAEARQHMVAYDQRWGEALFGASANQGTNDDAIIAAIDRARQDEAAAPKSSHASKWARGNTKTAENSL